MPTDHFGRVLVGLVDFPAGEEIWMHVAPTQSELESHGLKPGKKLENYQDDGMVDQDGLEGLQLNDRRRSRGIEQRYMERG